MCFLDDIRYRKVKYERTIVKLMLGKLSHNVFACVHGDMHIVSKLLLEKLSLVYKAGDGTNSAVIKTVDQHCAACPQTEVLETQINT